MATDVTCLQCGKPFDSSIVANRFAGVCPACLAKFAAADDDVESGPGHADPSFKPPLKPGGTFHGLEIAELLGAGGMGVVYKARQPGLNRFVALKVLSPKLTSDREFVARFNREARAMATLSHPGIVQVFDFGLEAELCFLVMEFVDGVSLRQLMKERRLSPEEALKIVPKICEALEYAHSKGVIHRDIKPENILVDREGRLKIADFGLARVIAPDGGASRVTVTNVVMGTPGYMAPEQYQSMKVDHRADIYSLGAVFYEMLTGDIPVGRFDPPSSKVQIDVRLDEIVLKTLATLPERRYQHAVDVKTDIEAYDSYFLPAPKPAKWPKNDPWMPRLLRVLLPALGLLGGVILAESWIMAIFGSKPEGSVLAVMALFIIAGSLFGIVRYDVRWGRPIPRWRWLATAGFSACGFAAFYTYAYLGMEARGLPTIGPFAGMGILAAGLFVMSLLEFRMMKSPAAGPLGDAHLPRVIQAPFRASTLAAASLAFVGISYSVFFIAAIAENGMRSFGPRSWQDADAAIWIMLFAQVVSVWLASKAILRREPRSGRLQAYVALIVGLPPLGFFVAAWHLWFTEPGAPRKKDRAPIWPRLSRFVIASLVFAMIGGGFTIRAIVLVAHDHAVSSHIPLLGVVSLLMGMALGFLALRAIRRSDGRLVGVSRARFSILLSLLALGVLTVGLTAIKREARGGLRSSSTVTVFGDYAHVESTEPPVEWFGGGGISGVTSGMRSGDGNVVADDSELIRECVKKAGFRETAARHIAAVSIRDHQEKGSDVEIHIWFAEVDTESDPASVLTMRRVMPGEITFQSGRFLMGIFTLQHPRGAELVERLARFYSDEITRVERAQGTLKK